MAIYRSVHLSFWTDNKVEDDFTPEDKYFYLYLMTNPQTNICGCYEVSYSQMMRHTGYNKDSINRLLERFEKVHKVICYDKKTKEVLILNWYKYNWSKSEKTLTGVENVAKHIKSDSLKEYIFYIINCVKNDSPIIGQECIIQKPSPDLGTVSDNKDNDSEIVKRIIDYLNQKCNTRYKHDTKNTIKHICARLKDGYTEEDFYIVIDKKSKEWIGTEHERYLRPDTLFAGKFESYLNQNIISKNSRNVYDEWREA